MGGGVQQDLNVCLYTHTYVYVYISIYTCI